MSEQFVDSTGHIWQNAEACCSFCIGISEGIHRCACHTGDGCSLIERKRMDGVEAVLHLLASASDDLGRVPKVAE